MIRALARRVLPRAVRNWVRAPSRSLEDLADAWRFRTGRMVTVELRPGWRVQCHPSAYRRAYAPLQHDPAQVDELDAFIREARPRMVLFDLGAHFGVFSLAALHYGGAEARAVAVDPSPVAATMLGVQGRLNDVADRLHIVRAAVSDTAGDLEMVSTGVVGAGYFVRPDTDHSRTERTLVDAVTVDGLCATYGVTPTHLKIDVEGFEAGVLAGARETLRAAEPPVVFLELHRAMIADRGGDPAEPLALLEAADYHTFDWDGTRRTREDILSHSLVRLIARRAPRYRTSSGDTPTSP